MIESQCQERPWISRFARRVMLFTVPVGMVLGGIASASAASPNYKYAEGGWLRVNPDFDGSDNGWFLGGAYGSKRFQAFAEFGDPGDVELLTIGAGWHGLLGEKADLVLQAAFVDMDLDDGLRFDAGIRWMVLDRLEINGFLIYTNLDVLDTTGLSLAAIWDFTKRWGVGGEAEFGDDVDTGRIFLRYNFGKR